MKKKIRTTSFWLGLSSAVVVLAGAIASIFGVKISSGVIEDVIMAICSVLICFGFVNRKSENGAEVSKEELLDEISSKDDEK